MHVIGGQMYGGGLESDSGLGSRDQGSNVRLWARSGHGGGGQSHSHPQWGDVIMYIVC